MFPKSAVIRYQSRLCHAPGFSFLNTSMKQLDFQWLY